MLRLVNPKVSASVRLYCHALCGGSYHRLFNLVSFSRTSERYGPCADHGFRVTLRRSEHAPIG